MATQVISRQRNVEDTKALIGGAYSAGDVCSESDTNAEGTAWKFTELSATNNFSGYITKAQVISESEAITPRFRLQLYSANPSNAELDDNAAAASPAHADLALFLGEIDFPAMISNGDDSYSTVTPSTPGNAPLWVFPANGTDDIYGILITLDAFTQSTGDDMTIKLTMES